MERGMETFKKSDRVKWEKNMREHEGEIFDVVPAGTSPAEVLKLRDLKGVNLKPLGVIAHLQPRNHESYLVEVRVGERGIKAIYWPSTQSLERVN